MGYPRQTVDICVGKGRDEGVQYRLKAQPNLTKKAGDSRTALVQVVPRRNVAQEEIVRRLAARSLVDEPMVRYVMDLLNDLIVTELKAGNTVTFNNAFTLGVSIPGRVLPQHPEDVKKLKLQPSVRFSPPFHRALNYKAKKQYLSAYQPTEVRVDQLYVNGNGCSAYGKFHNLQTLQVEMLIGEAVVPCRFELNKSAKSTRDIGKSLDIIPLNLPPPPGDRRVRFTYRLATGAIQTLVIDAVPFPSVRKPK